MLWGQSINSLPPVWPRVCVSACVLQLLTVNILVCEATHGAPHLFSWLSEVFLPVFLLRHQRETADKNYKMKSQLLLTAANGPGGQ